MKKHIFLFSSVALLSMSILAGCGPKVINPSVSEDDVTSEVTSSENKTSENKTSNQDVTSEVDTKTEINTETSETTDTTTSGPNLNKFDIEIYCDSEIVVSRKNRLNIKIYENAEETDNKDFTITSSDPDILQIDLTKGNRHPYIIGRKVGTAKVIVDLYGKKQEAEVSVIPYEFIQDKAFSNVKMAFERGGEKEASDLVSGTYSIEKENAQHVKLINEESTFEVFSNDKVRVITQEKGAYKATKTTCIGLANDDLVFYQTKRNKDGLTVTDETRSIDIGADINQDQALAYVKGVDLSFSGNISNVGVVKNFYNEYIEHNRAYTNNNYSTFKLVSKEINKFELTAHGDANSQFAETTLKYEISEDNRNFITSFEFSESKYYKKSGTQEKGGFASAVNIKATFKDGQRRESDRGFTNLNNLYFNSYVPAFYSSEYGDEEVNSVTVGKAVYPKIKNGVPNTALPSVDRLYISKITPEVEYYFDGRGLVIDQPGTYQVELANSKNVKSTLSLKVSELLVENIEVYGLQDTLELNKEHPFTISIEPYELYDTPLDVTVVNEGECDAQLKYIESEMYYTIKASKAGTATVEVRSDKYLKADGTPNVFQVSVTFGEKKEVTADEIAEGLVSGNWLKDGMFNTETTFTFTKDLDSASGTYKFIFAGKVGDGTYQVNKQGNNVTLDITCESSSTLKVTSITFMANESDENGLPDLNKLIVKYQDETGMELTIYLINLIE